MAVLIIPAGAPTPASSTRRGTQPRTASAGARAFYDEHRAKGESHDQAPRVLSNRLVGILDGCLRHRCADDEEVAWAQRRAADAQAARLWTPFETTALRFHATAAAPASPAGHPEWT